MLKRILILLMLFSLAACGSRQQTSPTPSIEVVEVEAAGVIAAALAELQPATFHVIMDRTASGLSGNEDLERVISLAKENIPGIDPQTLEAFRLRNTESQPVRSDMALGGTYILLSQELMKSIFSQNRDGWQLFYEQYPQAPGITTISQVGFNNAMDQALVYVGTMSHYLAGAGYIVYLQKVNGEWKVERKVMTWVS